MHMKRYRFHVTMAFAVAVITAIFVVFSFFARSRGDDTPDARQHGMDSHVYADLIAGRKFQHA